MPWYQKLLKVRSGSIFNRVLATMRVRYSKYKERPMWFDVYIAHPPFDEPRHNQKYENWGKPVRKIFYEEDIIRAQFFKRYGSGAPIHVLNQDHPSRSQRFWLKYKELKENKPELSEEGLWDLTAETLTYKGDQWGKIDLLSQEEKFQIRSRRFMGRQAQMTLNDAGAEYRK